MKILYSSEGGLLLTRCPLEYTDPMMQGIRVGSYSCTQCVHFQSIDRDTNTVECNISKE